MLESRPGKDAEYNSELSWSRIVWGIRVLLSLQPQKALVPNTIDFLNSQASQGKSQSDQIRSDQSDELIVLAHWLVKVTLVLISLTVLKELKILPHTLKITLTHVRVNHRSGKKHFFCVWTIEEDSLEGTIGWRQKYGSQSATEILLERHLRM